MVISTKVRSHETKKGDGSVLEVLRVPVQL